MRTAVIVSALLAGCSPTVPVKMDQGAYQQTHYRVPAREQTLTAPIRTIEQELHTLHELVRPNETRQPPQGQ